MGVSTDAILCFGIDLGEGMVECAELARINNDFGADTEEYLAHLAGVPGYGSLDFPGWEERNRRIAELPITIITHCSGDYPMHVLAIPGTEIRASRGYSEKVYASHMQVSQEKINAFMDWCSAHGVDVVTNEPTWVLCSMWL
jgi:hypothetical protein